MKPCLKFMKVGLLSGLSFGAWIAGATLESGSPVQIHAKAEFHAPLAAVGLCSYRAFDTALGWLWVPDADWGPPLGRWRCDAGNGGWVPLPSL